ncbi:MAG: hypothetical protein V1887_03800 [Candidatus Aenigmatarchaeota archaeon]
MHDKHDLIEIVRRLAAAGRTEPEIIGQMRAAGFRPAEIDEALRAVIKTRVEEHRFHPRPQARPPEHHAQPVHHPAKPAETENFRSNPPPELSEHRERQKSTMPEMTSIPESLRPIDIPGFAPKVHEQKEDELPEHPTEPITPITTGHESTGRGYRPTRELEMEELVEEIVEENLNKLQDRLGTIDHRDNQLEAQLAETRQLLEQAHNIDVKLQKSLENHNDEIKEFMTKFESRIAALEHAFKALSGHMKK